MNPKIFIKIVISIVIVIIMLILMKPTIVEPWLVKKIETTVNENPGRYHLKIEEAKILIVESGIEFKNISLVSWQSVDTLTNLLAEVENIRVTGINFIKLLFNKEIEIHKVFVLKSSLQGHLTSPEKSSPKKVSGLNVRINNVFLNGIEVNVKKSSSAQSVFLEKGVLTVYDIEIAKTDTLSVGMLEKLNFYVEKLAIVTKDSLYTLTGRNIRYITKNKTLSSNIVSAKPNFTNYNYTALFPYRQARVEATIKKIVLNEFSHLDYVSTGNIISSYISLDNIDVKVFIDKRKNFSPDVKPVFLERLYAFPGLINIDSIRVNNGTFIYTEQAENASLPGTIWFDKLNARIFKISNNPIFKNEKAYFDFKAEASFMSKAKLTVFLKGQLFDNMNSFEVSGNLSAMEFSEINKIVANNLSIVTSSGRIDGMNFYFSANNSNASGYMKLLYNGLTISKINKQTGKSNAIVERFTTGLVNLVVFNSNPSSGREVRTAAIAHNREPEKPFFNYLVKSLLSGIKPTLVNRKKGKK